MKNKNHDISCAILAGGKSKRLNGENKALLKIGDSSNLEKILAFSDKYFKSVMLISNDSSVYPEYTHVRVFEDILKDIGPLGGIHSALSNSESDNIFFLPCDMPFLKEELIKLEIEEYFTRNCDIIIPRMGNLIEPLHSIFSKRVLRVLEDHIINTNNYSIRSFFDKADVFYWDIEDNEENKKAFFNINTQHDLNEAHIKEKIQT